MSRSVALVLFVFLAVAAAADGVYLTLVHLDYETGQESVSAACHAFSESGCAVTAGRFGAIAGIPVAILGFAGSFTMAVLGVAAWRRRALPHDALRSILWALATIAVGVSALMAVLSFMEGSFCPFCVGWYGLNLGLWLTARAARNPEHTLADAFPDALGPHLGIAFGVGIAAFGAAVWIHHGIRDERLAARETELLAQAPALGAEIAAEMRRQPQKALALGNQPRRETGEGGVEIVEFGDFECPHCRRMWDALEAYVARTSQPLTLRFVNFPLDSACNPIAGDMHPHACDAARAALCADTQGQFWAYGTQLFEHQRDLEVDDLRGYAEALGLDIAAFDACLNDPATTERIREDVALGEFVDLQATPTLFVDGYELRGAVPEPILHAALDALLGAAPPS